MDKINPSRVEDKRCLSELGPKVFSSVDLTKFTSNFSESKKIGSGGYGVVFKGRLPSGILIAVKVLKNMDVVEDTFMAEVRTMGKVTHPNLIKLYGFCFEDVMKAFVFEYMEYGSLDKILYENHHDYINWEKLYGIAIGTAKGLNYLHNDLDEQIIHYDIKPANVLLDKNFSAKIADFGLTKIMNRDVSCVDVSRIRGTPGFIAPEIWTPGMPVGCKCDVYSFGMMLFEILGRRGNGVEENWFPGIVWKKFKSGKQEQLIRDCGIIEKDKEKAIILSKVALWCAHHIPERRPSMMDVVLMLTEKLPVRQPSYPFLPGQFSNSSMVPSQERFPQIFLEVPPARNERQWGNSLECNPAYPSYVSIAGGINNGQEDGGRTLPQLKSNVHKKQINDHPFILVEDMATLVPKKGMKLPTTKLVGKTTALKYKKKILQCIAKAEVVTVGIHGMGGVGKTTIFKHVHNQLLVEGNYFDKIIWVTVSKDGNIIKLQSDLAKELDLNLTVGDDVLRRSRLLFQALEKRKRVVFFFDDMWTKISLDEIGIPEPTQENGFKLVLTTRLLEVCQTMGCNDDNTIKVEPLPEDEALELFMKKVDCVLTPEVRKIAEMVAKKCFGLPLAIIIVGGTMRGSSNITKWTVALEDLNSRDLNNQTMNLKEDVFKCLKFSYDRLEDERQRKCFLCCAMYPEDWPILTRDLLDFFIMDGIVEGITRQDELVKGQYILNKLKDHCLLDAVDEVYDREYYETSNGVKMHDLIREMALRIANNCFMVKNGPGIKELPKVKEWKFDLERAFFMDSHIKAVSISPICPNLSTLILGSNFLKSITHDFFVHMESLKILALRCDPVFNNYHLELLPDSISDLVNLRVLRLGRYESLKKLPSLARLVLLRRLELNDTSIEELPEGMEMLVNLRCLNLHGVRLTERIPIGLISKLSALRELYLGGIGLDKLYDTGRGEAFAKELLSLKELENLTVAFHCMSDYACYVGSPEFHGLKCFYLTNWEGFYSLMGLHPLGPHPQATMALRVCDEHTALFFPLNTKRLEITLFHDVIKLTELKIKRCGDNENQALSANGWLRSLEEIRIDRCRRLYKIFEGISKMSSRRQKCLPVFLLKKLTISDCNNLKNVFSSSRLLQLLQNLEEIMISHCYGLKELIRDDEEEETETPIEISRLKKLRLCHLPKLKKIWRGVMICHSLESVFVDRCFRLKSLPQLKDAEQSTPPLALTIKGSRRWWDSLEWDSAYPKNILEPFFREIGTFGWPQSRASSECPQATTANASNRLLGTFGWPQSRASSECPQATTANATNRLLGTFGWPQSRASSECPQATTANATNHLLGTFGWPQSRASSECPQATTANATNRLLDFFDSNSDEEDSSMSEGEKCSESDKCPPKGKGKGIDREKTSQMDLNVPVGYVCHNCEYTLVGRSYRCKDCWEKCIVIIAERGVGFDLCQECYNTPSKHSERVKYHQRRGHTFELNVNRGHNKNSRVYCPVYKSSSEEDIEFQRFGYEDHI